MPAEQFKTPEWDKKFRSIFADIRQSKCVVFVGPEAIKIGGQSIRSVLKNHLLEYCSQDIAHYYHADGLFLFRDKIAKEDVEREVTLFYQEHNLNTDVDETLLLQLVRLRTFLILSINPDPFLSDIAYKYGIKHRFAYFRHGGKAVEEVEMPTIETPLYYNLCGSLDWDDSLVLDYDDLFSLLSSLLGSPGIPPNLALSLQQAKHFLFVGFDFNKWYSQLLLRLLTGEKAIRKFVVDPSNRSDDTTTFLVKQFGIEFIENEAGFLEELFSRAEAESLLHKTVDANSPESLKVTRFLRNGDIPAALTQLGINPAWSKEATILLVRYNAIKEREMKKLIDSKEYTIEYNRIIDAIIETVNSL